MLSIRGKIISDNCGFGRIFQSPFNIIESEYPANLGHVKRTVTKGHAIGHIQTLCQGKDLVSFVVAVSIYDGVDFARFASGDKKRALFSHRHGPSILYLICVNIYLESNWQLDLIEMHALPSPRRRTR